MFEKLKEFLSQHVMVYGDSKKKTTLDVMYNEADSFLKEIEEAEKHIAILECQIGAIGTSEQVRTGFVPVPKEKCINCNVLLKWFNKQKECPYVCPRENNSDINTSKINDSFIRGSISKPFGTGLGGCNNCHIQKEHRQILQVYENLKKENKQLKESVEGFAKNEDGFFLIRDGLQRLLKLGPFAQM
jgi:hypothetical protein